MRCRVPICGKRARPGRCAQPGEISGGGDGEEKRRPQTALTFLIFGCEFPAGQALPGNKSVLAPSTSDYPRFSFTFEFVRTRVLAGIAEYKVSYFPLLYWVMVNDQSSKNNAMPESVTAA